MKPGSRTLIRVNIEDAQLAEKQEQNKIGKRCEIANAKSAKYTEKPSGAIVCEPDECVCGYDIVVKESNKYTCQKWTKAPSCLSQDLDTNATKGHYECKNNKKVCVIDECDYKAHYLDSAKNKCIAKSTVKCADDEKVDNAGKCQKNIKVGPMNNSDLEMTQDDINRDNCIRGQDKKHSKWENNKCVCESNDYEMQSDGYCTLKRAKCLKQRNTKYENGRCICTSSDFEMHKDNNCYYTSEALERESDAMEEADYEEELKQQDIETRKKLCTDKNHGNWNEKKEKCECKDKKQFFDDDKGCVDATSEYNTAKQQLDTLKTQYDTKVKEIYIK
jgi:hypothetical protein